MIKRSYTFFKTIFPSFIGLYIALFWIADARYANAVSRLEARATNLVTRLESDQWRKAIELLPNLQNRKIPTKPSFFCPLDVIYSLMSSYDDIDLEVVEELQDIVVAKKNELNELNLYGLVLQSKSNDSNLLFECEQDLDTFYIDFSQANLRESISSYDDINE
jgi:hypothetical protein